MSQQGERKPGHFASGLKRYAVAAFWVYYTLLFLWAGGYIATGDRYPAIMVLNMVALYLFVPVPLAVIAAILLRRRELWAGVGISLVLFVALWGQLFLPPREGIEGDNLTLVVMTYNARGYNEDVEPSIELLETVNADVVILQEVNAHLARALEAELGDVYPYQVLDPYSDVRGMGTISRLPLYARNDSLPLEWVGTPQILAVEWEGQRVTLVNFHMWAAGLGPAAYMEINARAREAQALYLIDFAQSAASQGPVIIAGDVNATPQSDTVRMMARWLEDSWTEAGFGFGHTFPGRGSSPQSSPSPQFYGIPVPQWLFRIDYVFHTAQLVAVEAFTAPFDGVSDHRGVVVVFSLRE